jgi:hypothetical protein
MNRAVEAVLIFVAVFLLLFGFIFLIASGIENTAIGAVMVLVSLALIFVVYRMEKAESAKPKLISQTFNVKMEGTGSISDKEVKCRSCGAPLTDKDLMVIQGGIMVKCSYCGATYAMEEAPKW